MNNLKKIDLLLAVIIGEIAAWLLIILGKVIISPDAYEKFSGLIKLLPIIFPVICVAFFYVAFLVSKKIAIVYQIAKFVLVGGLNTLVDWGILAFLIFFFRKFLIIDSETVLLTIFSVAILYYSLYKSISFIIATLNSYVWNKLWTFKRQATESVGKEFTQFIIVSVIGFLINVGIASGIFKFLAPVGGLNSDQWAIAAAVIATAVSMIWNFLGYKFIVFDVKPTPGVGKENYSRE